MTRVRWWVLSLLLLGTTFNYLDRIVFSTLDLRIRESLHYDDVAYGYIFAAFQIAYGAGFLIVGKFVDRVGVRIGYGVSIACWSIAAACHALASSAFSLGFWRAMLGFGESGNFPSAIKAVAEWFPKKDRALATGIFNAGTNIAVMIGPPILAYLFFHFGWRMCFLLPASFEFLLVVLWFTTYRSPEKNKRANAAELSYIRSGSEAEESTGPKLGWGVTLGMKQTWGFAMAKFFSDSVWWFYLTWLPSFFERTRGLSLKEIAWTLPVIYLMADFGSVAGGWLSGFLIRRGWPGGRARKTTLAICASCMPIAAMSAFAPNLIVTVALVSLATAAHQGWSANLFTTVSDVFPKRAVASVVGIGGAVGAVGNAMFSAILAGLVVKYFGYTPMILLMGCFHLTALALLHLLMGDLSPVQIPKSAEAAAQS
jgi:ACS family hexuronate transporter-like MFS transporter